MAFSRYLVSVIQDLMKYDIIYTLSTVVGVFQAIALLATTAKSTILLT